MSDSGLTDEGDSRRDRQRGSEPGRQARALVGQGGAHAAGGQRGLFAQRGSGAHIRVYIIQRAPADWIAADGLTIADTDALRARLLTEFAAWSPRMRQLVAGNDGPYADRPIFALPVPHTWEHNPAVTLLGDAAHVMPPLGVGRQPRHARRQRPGSGPRPQRHGRRGGPRLRGHHAPPRPRSPRCWRTRPAPCCRPTSPTSPAPPAPGRERVSSAVPPAPRRGRRARR